MMTVLKRMLMKCEGDKIVLLPAWPKDWSVMFKLHASKSTAVECEFRDGKLVKLNVKPESRLGNIILPD